MALLAFAALNVLTPSDVFAQNANDGGGTVSGVVTDDQGPVIGAAVMIKDGQGGVTTGFDGGDVIVVSILGYETQEIPYVGQATQDVKLSVSTEFLDEVVVTALGIKREEKTLSYNVQSVKSEELTAVKDANFVNSLVGKVAGVTINSGASGPGSATRVVMRGMKSIEKSNTVLYVIDGIITRASAEPAALWSLLWAQRQLPTSTRRTSSPSPCLPALLQPPSTVLTQPTESSS